MNAANAAIASLAYGLVAIVSMHFFRADLAPAHHMISEYSTGPYGLVMRSAFLTTGVGCAAFSIGLVRSGPVSIMARISSLLFGIASLGLATSAIFNMDLPGSPATQAGEIHNMSFLVNVVSLLLGITLLSAACGKDVRWRSYQRTALLLTGLIVVAFVLQFLSFRKGAPYGLANRFLLVALSAWIFATAFRLRAVAASRPLPSASPTTPGAS
jgi:hypothetical protein